MNVLQQLGLCRGRITTEQNVDFATEATSSCAGEFFAHSAKQLSQYSLLYVLVFPDRGCKRVDELVVEVRLGCEFSELPKLFFTEQRMFLPQALIFNSVVLIFTFLFGHLHIYLSLFSVFVFDIDSGFISLKVSDYVHVGAVHVFKFALIGVHADAHGFENASNFYAVSRAHLIYHIVIGAQMNSLRSFALGYTFGRLLDLDVLLVREHAVVVHNFKSVGFFAIFALSRLIDSAFVQ